LDSTVAGLGRGAGNLRTEEVMTHRLGTKSPEMLGYLFDLATKDLPSTSIREFRGYSPFFVLSGLSNIHPDYANEIIESAVNSSARGIIGLSRITPEVAKKYDKNFLVDTLTLDDSSEPFDLEVSERHSELRRAMLIGPGIKDEEHSAIFAFAKRNGIHIFALNQEVSEAEAELSGRFFASLPRFMASKQFFRQTSKACLIAPFDRLTSAREELEILGQNSEATCVRYGLQTKSPDELETWRYTHCELETPQAFPYALAYLATGGAKEIYLAGFNGYLGQHDPRWGSSQAAIDTYQQSFSGRIFSLTPTNYNLSYASPHGPVPKENL
jgi:4-hydroxy 2-oxovalerate aldolase